jgi:hypothetical protein
VVDGHGLRSMPNRLHREPVRDAILTITAQARIHCGLLNTSGLFTRVDGGIGFSVEDPLWEIEVECGKGLGKSKIPSEFVSAVDSAMLRLRSLWNIPPLAVYCKKFVSESVEFSTRLRKRKSLIDQYIEL